VNENTNGDCGGAMQAQHTHSTTDSHTMHRAQHLVRQQQARPGQPIHHFHGPPHIKGVGLTGAVRRDADRCGGHGPKLLRGSRSSRGRRGRRRRRVCKTAGGGRRACRRRRTGGRGGHLRSTRGGRGRGCRGCWGLHDGGRWGLGLLNRAYALDHTTRTKRAQTPAAHTCTVDVGTRTCTRTRTFTCSKQKRGHAHAHPSTCPHSHTC
jgi:hypothetical protein